MGPLGHLSELSSSFYLVSIDEVVAAVAGRQGKEPAEVSERVHSVFMSLVQVWWKFERLILEFTLMIRPPTIYIASIHFLSEPLSGTSPAMLSAATQRGSSP